VLGESKKLSHLDNSRPSDTLAGLFGNEKDEAVGQKTGENRPRSWQERDWFASKRYQIMATGRGIGILHPLKKGGTASTVKRARLKKREGEGKTNCSWR